MRKQVINSSSLRIAVRKNYSLLLARISLFAFASVAIAAKHLAVVDVGSATSRHGVMWLALHGDGLMY